MVLSALAALTLATAAPARAQQSPPLGTAGLISADQISYDDKLGVVTASGNVEIAQGDRVLLADTISYNMRTDVVTASGNLSLLEPTGDVVFANFVELSGDLREGFVRDIRVLMRDRSRLAAASGRRTGGNKTVFRRAVYSPCRSCREDPDRPPLWQIKAYRVEHDQEAGLIKYRDAWMEIFGVPVFYTPYFQHPDPTVKRKSGLLSPTLGVSEILGVTYQQPYYWAIGPDRDATIAPIITSKQGVVFAGEYRELFPNGRITLRGSGTFADLEEKDGTIEDNTARGHIDSTARFDINDSWRWGIDAQRASDDTYLRIYDFSNDRTLTSRAFAEGFNGRNYLSVNSYVFQGLRATDNNDESPIILPQIDYNFVGEPNLAGARTSFDGNFMVLSRVEGRESRRVSTALGWELPYTGPAGDIYKVTAKIRGDGYWVQGVDPNSDVANPSGSTVSKLTGRVFPQLAAEWRYPWVRHDGTMHQVIEPIAQAVVAPAGGNSGAIPNEDSLDFEFDDTNLFSLNRFPGFDRVDPGSRVDYGLKYTVTGDGGGYTSAFVGQSYRFNDAGIIPDGSGLEDDFSDIVGRIQIKPTHAIDLLYRFRLDKNNLSVRRNELDVRAGPPALNLDLSYISINSGLKSEGLDDRQELNWTVNSRLTRFWSAFGGQRIDLNAGDTLKSRIGLTYQCDCFRIDIVAERTAFSDREIEPENTFFVNVVFKNLGGFSTTDATSPLGVN